jgi:hypothetical protein
VADKHVYMTLEKIELIAFWKKARMKTKTHFTPGISGHKRAWLDVPYRMQQNRCELQVCCDCPGYPETDIR